MRHLFFTILAVESSLYHFGCEVPPTLFQSGVFSGRTYEYSLKMTALTTAPGSRSYEPAIKLQYLQGYIFTTVYHFMVLFLPLTMSLMHNFSMISVHIPFKIISFFSSVNMSTVISVYLYNIQIFAVFKFLCFL